MIVLPNFMAKIQKITTKDTTIDMVKSILAIYKGDVPVWLPEATSELDYLPSGYTWIESQSSRYPSSDGWYQTNAGSRFKYFKIGYGWDNSVYIYDLGYQRNAAGRENALYALHDIWPAATIDDITYEISLNEDPDQKLRASIDPNTFAITVTDSGGNSVKYDWNPTVMWWLNPTHSHRQYSINWSTIYEPNRYAFAWVGDKIYLTPSGYVVCPDSYVWDRPTGTGTLWECTVSDGVVIKYNSSKASASTNFYAKHYRIKLCNYIDDPEPFVMWGVASKVDSIASPPTISGKEFLGYFPADDTEFRTLLYNYDGQALFVNKLTEPVTAVAKWCDSGKSYFVDFSYLGGDLTTNIVPSKVKLYGLEVGYLPDIYTIPDKGSSFTFSGIFQGTPGTQYVWDVYDSSGRCIKPIGASVPYGKTDHMYIRFVEKTNRVTLHNNTGNPEDDSFVDIPVANIPKEYLPVLTREGFYFLGYRTSDFAAEDMERYIDSYSKLDRMAVSLSGRYAMNPQGTNSQKNFYAMWIRKDKYATDQYPVMLETPNIYTDHRIITGTLSQPLPIPDTYVRSVSRDCYRKYGDGYEGYPVYNPSTNHVVVGIVADKDYTKLYSIIDLNYSTDERCTLSTVLPVAGTDYYLTSPFDIRNPAAFNPWIVSTDKVTDTTIHVRDFQSPYLGDTFEYTLGYGDEPVNRFPFMWADGWYSPASDKSKIVNIHTGVSVHVTDVEYVREQLDSIQSFRPLLAL